MNKYLYNMLADDVQTRLAWFSREHVLMPALNTPAATWTLDGTVASMGSARLDVAMPAWGIAVAGPGAPDQLLGLDLRDHSIATAALADRWVRGDDVVAIYQPADPRRLTATAMWRSLPREPAAWELILSAQTSLVESDPSLAVTCDVASGEVVVGHETAGRVSWSSLAPSVPCPAGVTCGLVRRATDTMLIAVHPANARRIVVARDHDRVRITCWLFSSDIEKGVLLRGRVLATIGPADTDMEWASDCVTALAASPPALTA